MNDLLHINTTGCLDTIGYPPDYPYTCVSNILRHKSYKFILKERKFLFSKKNHTICKIISK